MPFFNYQIIQATEQPFTPITQENIKIAVDEWMEDPITAEAKYGHIKDWDVSNVTDMYSMFF